MIFMYCNVQICNFVCVEIVGEAVGRDAEEGISDKTCRDAKWILFQDPILPHDLLFPFFVKIHPIQLPII